MRKILFNQISICRAAEEQAASKMSLSRSTFVFCVVMLCACVMLMLVPLRAHAADESVSDWSSLQSAVKNASTGDTITLEADIDATSSASICVKKSITIDGQGHTIDGQDKYGMFVTKGGSLTLKNTTIANAYRSSEKKGCVLYAYSGGGGTFENCVIVNCRDAYSSSTGVINCGSYNLELNHCTIIDNSRGVTAGNSGSVKNSILVGNGTDLIFKSSSSSFGDGGYNLIAKTSSQPSSFGAETTIIDESLSDHSNWLTAEGDLIVTPDSPAINKIPVGEGVEDIGGRQHESVENVSEINIVTPPVKTDYLEGQKFSRNGLVVQAIYEDGTVKTIASYSIEPSGPLALEDDKVIVSFGGKTAEIPITVSEADVIDTAGKLKEAITENNNTGDAVLKLEKDITLDSNWTSTVSITKDLIIDGNGYTINGAGQYALALNPSSSANLTVRNLEARNMKRSSSNSAFIYASSSSYKGTITLQNVVLRGNTGYYGTIYVKDASSSTLNMDHCTVIHNAGTNTSSSGYTALYYSKGKANINDCIFVGNTYGDGNKRDITLSSSVTLSASNNVIGAISGKTPDSTNKVDSEYNDYENWMDTNGELFYPTMDGKENPAVDIHASEVPADALAADFAGAVRPQGRGGDAGAYESAVFDAAKPTLSQNLSPDPDNYIVGDEAEPLSIKASVKDDGELVYEWYYIDYIDAVTTATRKVDNAKTDTLTPATDSVGSRSYFAVAYNRNESNTWINGKNGVFDEDADADTRRTKSVYAISEHHPVNVSVEGLVLTGIEVTKAPDKTEYVEGQKFDSEGIEVSGVYTDTNSETGITKVFPISAGYTFDPAGALTTDVDSVTINYEGFTVEQPITVTAKVVTSIEIASAPTKLTYDEGEVFSKTGMAVKAYFNDDTSRTLTADEYTVEPAEDLTKDVTSVIIEYVNTDGTKCTAEQPITVGINNISQFRSALENAAAGDTLTLTADITMDDGAALAVSKNLTIKGAGHRIYGGDNGFIDHTGGDLTLLDLEVIGMSSDTAAVLYSHGNCGNATLKNCILRGNAAIKGAVYFDPGAGEKLTVEYSTIIDNKSASKAADRSVRSMAKSGPSGYAGGINVTDDGSLELYADIITGNVLSTRFEDYDVRADNVTSNGFNVIGVTSGFETAATDRVNAQYADHASWLNKDGTPVNTETSVLLAEGYRPAATEGDTDLTGNPRCDATNAGALELADSYDHGDAPDPSDQPDPEDQAAADAVAEAIGDLPDVDSITLDDEQAVLDALAAFENLTEEQKAIVDPETHQKLEDAATKIAELKSRSAVETATVLIAGLTDADEITLESESAVNEANAAFSNLTEEQKTLIPAELKEKLKAANAAIGRLQAEEGRMQAAARSDLAAAVIDALSQNVSAAVYTKSTYDAFTGAVADAQSILKKDGATTDEFDTARTALESAQKSLTEKKANPLTIKPRTATVKYSKLKKKAQTLAVTKVIKFTKKLNDKKTYTLVLAKKGSKSFKKYFKINKTTGKVTIKKNKKMKKGTYKVKVKIQALGNSNYKASAVKTVTFKVKIK